MNQFQGPGPERPAITRESNAHPRLTDFAEVAALRFTMRLNGYWSAEGFVWREGPAVLFEHGEDPDVEPLTITEEDEEWARDRVRRLLGGGPDW
jgi:hypothetical protein